MMAPESHAPHRAAVASSPARAISAAGAGSGDAEEVEGAGVRGQVEAVEGRLGGAVGAPAQGGRPAHARGEGAAVFALKVDAEAVRVLGVLQQEPGAAVALLAGGAGVGGWLLLTL